MFDLSAIRIPERNIRLRVSAGRVFGLDLDVLDICEEFKH
jgi:hypothetical protein